MEIDDIKKTTKNSLLLRYVALLFLIISVVVGLFFSVSVVKPLIAILIIAGSFITGILGWFFINLLSDTLSSLETIVDNTARYVEIRELLLDIRDNTKYYYKEKRSTKRLGHAISVNYSVGDSAKVILTKTKNIGEYGCFLKTPESLQRGEILHLEIFIPTFPNPVKTSAKVVFVAEQKLHPALYPGVGLQYIDIKKEDQLKVREFIYTQSERS